MYTELIRSSRYGQFAIEVTSLHDLPPAVEMAFSTRLEPEEAIQSIIIAPTQRVMGKSPHQLLRFISSIHWRLSPAWVLVLTANRVLVATVSDPDCPPEMVSISFSDLLSIEFGEILLFSWIQFHWKEAYTVSELTVYFNAVSDYYFFKLLSFILLTVAKQSGVVTHSRAQNQELLAQLPYKFKTIIPTYLLLTNEQVLAAIHQPPIYKTVLKSFRWQEHATNVLVLTNYHLLIVSEKSDADTGDHGWVARICPRQKIGNVFLDLGENEIIQPFQLQPQEKPERDPLKLNIILGEAPWAETIRLPVERRLEPQLHSLIASMENKAYANAGGGRSEGTQSSRSAP